jgi:hypothetical protein
MNRIFAILLISILNIVSVWADEKTESQPLELPSFYIEGKDPINVQSGSKEFPDNRLTLSKMELDSLNSLEKQKSLLLPTKAFTSNIETISINKGFLRGEFGRYLSPKVDFGYSLHLGEAKVLLNAGAEYSGGHIDNSDYSSFNIKLTNDYIAPSKFWIFGGSRTFTNIKFSNNNFKLYADTLAPARSLINFDLNLGSEGSANGYNFSTGAGFNTAMISQSKHDLSNINIDGHLKIWTKYQDYIVGGNANVRFGTFKTGIHFTQFNGIFNFKIDSNISFNNDLGIQLAGNTLGEEQFGFLFNSAMNYTINKDFTFKAILSNGLENNSLDYLLKYNPYINDTLNMIFGNDFKIKTIAYYHPDEKISIGAGLFFGLNSNTPYFVYNNDGSFLTNYAETTRFGFTLEGNWTPTENDAILLNFIYNYKTLSSNSNIMPNYSPLNLYLNYSRKLIENLNGKFGIKYVGEKFGDIDNKMSINGFIDINFGFEYKINDKLEAYLRVENLLNSDVYYLDRYRQRGLFGALGINLIF